MPLSPTSWPGSSSGGGTVLFDSTLSGAAASIDTGAGVIVGGFRSITIYCFLRTSEAATLSSFGLIVNDDGSAIYDRVRVRTLNATVTGVNALAQASWGISTAGANATAGVFGVHVFELPNYDATTGNKHGQVSGGVAAQVAADALYEAYALGYRSTTAITRAKITAGGGANFAVGSRFTVLGI